MKIECSNCHGNHPTALCPGLKRANVKCKTCGMPFVAGRSCPSVMAQFVDLSDGDGMCHPQDPPPPKTTTCLHNRSDEHSITLVLVDFSRVVIPPNHGADVTQQGSSKFLSAVVLSPEELRERYGDD